MHSVEVSANKSAMSLHRLNSALQRQQQQQQQQQLMIGMSTDKSIRWCTRQFFCITVCMWISAMETTSQFLGSVTVRNIDTRLVTVVSLLNATWACSIPMGYEILLTGDVRKFHNELHSLYSSPHIKVNGQTVKFWCSVRTYTSPLSVTDFWVLTKLCTKQSSKVLKRTAFNLVVTFVSLFDIMKFSCFEGSIHFRESKPVGWFKIGWIRWVVDLTIMPQFSRKCFTYRGKISRGLGVLRELVAFLLKLWPLKVHFSELYSTCM